MDIQLIEDVMKVKQCKIKNMIHKKKENEQIRKHMAICNLFFFTYLITNYWGLFEKKGWSFMLIFFP